MNKALLEAVINYLAIYDDEAGNQDNFQQYNITVWEQLSSEDIVPEELILEQIDQAYPETVEQSQEAQSIHILRVRTPGLQTQGCT